MLPSDHGPIYRETNMFATIREPFNMASAALFIAIAVYWLVQLKGRRDTRFQYWINCGLLVGGLGGTLFHGFRVHFIFLALDFVPILGLSIATAFYFWFKVLPRRRYVLIPLLILIVGRGLLYLAGYERATQINASYGGLGFFIILPVILFLLKSNGVGAPWVFCSIVMFGLALFCRANDFAPYFAAIHGGHWLWHVFGAASVGALQIYLFRVSFRHSGRINGRIS